MHTTPPPELIVPTKYDVLFPRGDFNGVTLDGAYSPTDTASIIANGGCTIISGRWNGLFIPLINGANTTPPTMIMTPMLSVYWMMGCTKLVDAVLTCHAERNYSDMITSGTTPWENATISIQNAIAFGKLVKSWGFYNVIWQGDPTYTADWGPLVDADLCNRAIIGEEVDRKVTSEQYDAILRSLRSGPLNGIPSCAHFTSNYPVGFPRDTFLTNWADFNGWLHLAWQADQNQTAGTQGAMLYYARQRVNLGTVGGDGRPAPGSFVILHELMASKQLIGQCTEEYGCLRSLENLYCPADNPAIAMVHGGGNGMGRYPDGMVM